jgi:hypothetical protein
MSLQQQLGAGKSALEEQLELELGKVGSWAGAPDAGRLDLVHLVHLAPGGWGTVGGKSSRRLAPGAWRLAAARRMTVG